MNITYLLDFLPTYVARETAALADKGISISIHLPPGSPDSNLWDKVLSEDGSKHPVIPISRDLPLHWCTLPFLQLARESLKKVFPLFLRMPFRFTHYAFKALISGTFRYFLAGAAYARNALIEKPDLLHTHFAKDAAHIAMWAGTLLDIPFTVTTHAQDIFVPESDERLAKLLKNAQIVFTISHFNRAFLLKRFGETFDNKMKITHLGLESKSLPGREKSSSDMPTVMCVASGLVPKKGVDVLLQACKTLQSRYIRFRCIIAGTDQAGDRLEHFRKAVKECGLDKIVEFRGLMSSKQVLEAVSSATLFVLPSVEAPNGDMDGIPVALMEAMGIGVPAISTKLTGIPELIEDGVNGLLTTPGNHEELADAIEKLLTDPDLAEDLASHGREKVLKDFSVDRYTDDLIEAWTALLSNNIQ
ncbi:MAG: glycosyltransferase family 4 protein [Candidatus Fermentibacteraceae bacterium]|nr:glycosyltransferase family 4 protein [Candidatus Fermentibacteraceae bacterium]